ncbi:MAG: LysR substrate-binding domain-containing protein [Pseudomonadota bacterium]
MGNFTLRQLKYFDALTRQGHFGRAADASAISQPALSLQIAALEESFGTPLFERGARAVRLTAFGEEIAERVRSILRAADELADVVRAAQDGAAGRLRLGIIPTIAPYLLPDILAKLGAEFPKLDVHVRETLTNRLIADLHDGKLDAAIVALPVSEPSLAEVALFDENLLLVRAKTARNEPVPDAASLSGMRLLLLEEGHCFRDQALSFCGLDSKRDGLEGSSLSTLVQMAAAGMGVTFIPQMARAVETRAAPVNVVDMGPGGPQRTVGMVWRKSSPMADQLGDIAQAVRSAAQSA